MEMRARIAMVVRMTNHTPSSFADAIGINRSTLSHILNGRNNPSLDVLERIVLHFPKVSAHWLITGKQDVPLPEAKPAEPVLQPTPNETTPGAAHARTIQKVLVFYSDGTFSEIQP
jgi:DNA-binding XRE family transcriptional regulator